MSIAIGEDHFALLAVAGRFTAESRGRPSSRSPMTLRWGEDVGAWVVRTPGRAVTADELRAFCAGRLSDDQVPRAVTFLAALPRTATGKVLERDRLGRGGLPA